MVKKEIVRYDSGIAEINESLEELDVSGDLFDFQDFIHSASGLNQGKVLDLQEDLRRDEQEIEDLKETIR